MSRPNGWLAEASSSHPSVAPWNRRWIVSSAGVFIQPGWMRLTRMRWRSSANDEFFVMATRACFEAA